MHPELFALAAGSALRPGIPAALWLGSRTAPKRRRRSLINRLARRLGGT